MNDASVVNPQAAAEVRTNCFVVGMPRAATTWMCKCLNEHPDVACFGESMFFGRGWREPQHAGKYSRDELDAITETFQEAGCLKSVLGDGPGCLKNITEESWKPAIRKSMEQLDAPASVHDVWHCLASTIATLESKPTGIDKTPHHLNWIDRIVDAVPDARFVVMLREPYGFTLSYKHIGDARHEQAQKNFKRRYHPFGCSIVWKGCLISAHTALAKYPDRIHVVHFDDVNNKPDEVLAGVQQFFDLNVIDDLADRVPPDNTSYVDGPKPTLRGDDAFWVNLVAGKARRNGGYQKQRAPFEPARVLWSILRLPFWAFQNVMDMRRIVRGSLVAYLWRWIRPARS